MKYSLLLPDFLVRFIGLFITGLCYRIKTTGIRNIPAEGPALLVPNHVTWVDALLLSATQQRRIRFIMERSIYNTRFLRPLFSLMGVIPISSEDPPKEIIRSFRIARQELDNGHMVCIFAEGTLTRNGAMQEFKPGFERIVKGRDHPIIPVYIGGAWGSIFSYAHGKLFSRLPLAFPYSVSIIFGKAMSASSRAAEVEQAVVELSVDYFNLKKPFRKSLAEDLVISARKHWSCHAISDTSGKRLTYGRMLAAVFALASEIRSRTAGEEKVGILLPPSAGGALANLAVTHNSVIPVNLNYTASADAFRSAIDQCRIRTVISSRAVLEKVELLDEFEGVLFLEDLVEGISSASKLFAWLKARFMPLRIIFSGVDVKADNTATIIFSSGTTGKPKGVMLTHHNIISNVEALQMVIRATPKENICSALPFFHSLGYTGTIWFPLLSGFSAAYHVNPMEGAKIAEVVRENGSTLLIATPIFLLAYIHRAKAEDFKTLRLVITGAEKLKMRVADTFEKKFGIRPLEGYGTTEMSPIVTLNLPDVWIDGVVHIGSREGSVGHPVPGVAIKVVDPDTGVPLPIGGSGMILVKGPNLMSGYLGLPELTEEVIRDGWYVTGDIGLLGRDGFLTITDRLSRFSKIAGEMVPHIAVEEEFYDRLKLSGQVLAVTSVHDEKKGEKLVILYTEEAGDKEVLQKIIDESSIPNLWKPNRDCYIRVDSIPVLGSGKLDLQALKSTAFYALAE